jgi:hypothetical protein
LTPDCSPIQVWRKAGEKLSKIGFIEKRTLFGFDVIIGHYPGILEPIASAR